LVKRTADFRLNPDPGDSGDPVETLLLVQVDAQGRARENFRFPLAGGHLEADIWAKDIFVTEKLEAFRFRYEVQAGRVDIKLNAFSTKWEDWGELLARGSLVAYEGNSTEDRSQEVREFLTKKNSEDPSFGASLRWIIQARSRTGLDLVLQGLPRPAGHLRRDARLTTDHCGAVELARIPLETNMRGEAPCCGPEPILFAKDPTATSAALASDPQILHTGKV